MYIAYYGPLGGSEAAAGLSQQEVLLARPLDQRGAASLRLRRLPRLCWLLSVG